MSPEWTTIFTWIGSSAAAAFTAGCAYVFTKWREREAEWRKEKRKHYNEFAICLSSVVREISSDENRVKFAHACNKLNLIAPQTVIEALKVFQDETSISNSNKDDNRHNELMSKVFLEMRQDLKISPKDNWKTFRVRLWSPGPLNNR
jgi:hypothetical protein